MLKIRYRIEVIGAIGSDNLHRAFKGKPDLLSEDQVPIKVSDPYLLSFTIHIQINISIFFLRLSLESLQQIFRVYLL